MSLPSTDGITPYLQAYSYDNLDRLTSSAAGTYTYGDPNHPHAVTGLSDMPNQYASYDAMGNLTCRNTDTTSGHTCSGSSPSGATMTYDAQGRLSSWTAPSGISANEYLLYDNEGNLVLTRTVTPNGNTSPIDFGVTETVLTSSTTATTNYYFVDGQRVAEQVGSTFSYLIPNLEGSPTVALSSTGTVSAVQLFLPYGAQGFAWGTMPTPHNYTDQLLDSEMGLLYYGARWYDPLADQFVSADSVQGDPSGMNPYGYVGGNPETFVDPTGQRIADICDEDPEDCDTNANSRENQGTIGPYRAPTNGLPPDEGNVPSSAVVVPEVTVALGDTTFTLDEGTNMITEETIGPNGEPEFTTITPNDPNYLATMDEMEALQEGGFPDEGANTTAQGLSDESGSASPQTTNDNGNSSTNASENGSSSSSSSSSSSESNASPCGDGLSFAYNTPVATVKGEQAIGTLKVGEKVWAYNPQTKKMELEVIQKVWLNHDNDLVNVTLVATVKDAQGKTTQKKEVIHTNEKHPFLTKEKGFIPVSQLKPGMHVLEANGNYGMVAKLVVVPGAQWMYNLTVAQDHTYAVGMGQWVVHNATCTVKDLDPLHSPETSGNRPGLQNLSDQELLDSVNNNPQDPIRINTNTGKIMNGNGRAYELLRRALDPGSSITPDTPIYYEPYTPSSIPDPWNEPPGLWDLFDGEW